MCNAEKRSHSFLFRPTLVSHFHLHRQTFQSLFCFLAKLSGCEKTGRSFHQPSSKVLSIAKDFTSFPPLSVSFPFITTPHQATNLWQGFLITLKLVIFPVSQGSSLCRCLSIPKCLNVHLSSLQLSSSPHATGSCLPHCLPPPLHPFLRVELPPLLLALPPSSHTAPRPRRAGSCGTRRSCSAAGTRRRSPRCASWTRRSRSGSTPTTSAAARRASTRCSAR